MRRSHKNDVIPCLTSARKPQNLKITSNFRECSAGMWTTKKLQLQKSAQLWSWSVPVAWGHVRQTCGWLSVYQGKSKTIRRFINSFPIHMYLHIRNMQTWLSCPAIPRNPHRWHQGLPESRQASVSSLFSLLHSCSTPPFLPLPSLLIWCCNFTLRLHPFIQNFCHPSHYLWGALHCPNQRSNLKQCPMG